MIPDLIHMKYYAFFGLLILTKLDPDISGLEKSVDPDQLASEKPADQDTHCYTLSLKRPANYLNPACFYEKMGG